MFRRPSSRRFALCPHCLPHAGRDADDERGRDGHPGGEGEFVAADELAEQVGRGRRAGDDDFVREMPLEIEREAVGRVVAVAAVFLQALHHDPVNVATERAGQLRAVGVPALRGGRQLRAVEGLDSHRRSRRIDLADDAPDFIHPGVP